MTDPVLVEVTRGADVESVHRGSIVVVDARGKRRAAIGDVDHRVFPRSAIKALQALPLVESGAADRFGFGDAELALACSSHSAESRHVATAVKMLAAAGRGEGDLECGGHAPVNKTAADELVRAGKAPTSIHDNCSGKHAGFVCLACHLGLDPKGYTHPDHAAMREVTTTIGEMAGIDPGRPSIDGCSAPAYALPLESLALAFARMATGQELAPARGKAARRLIDACIAEPVMMAGTGRFDTDALTLFGDRLFVKSGAEGVFCAAFPKLGFGVAIKCNDGAQRGPETAMAAVIDAFLPLTEPERTAFAGRLAPPVTTRTGREVGEIRPVAGLVAALREGRAVS